jgi:hypothetical protein
MDDEKTDLALSILLFFVFMLPAGTVRCWILRAAILWSLR